MPRLPKTAIWPFAKPVDNVPKGTLVSLKRQAVGCQACPLWRDATQTVFGRGPAQAILMLIGEQPGHSEDLAGEPFVGPAGQLLRETLQEAGLDVDALYLTNAVKHFKFEQRGKLRVHKRANAAEQQACRMWLAAEVAVIRPKLVVGLGAMASQTIFGSAFRLTQERGTWHSLAADLQAMATWHPSAILRMSGLDREKALGEMRMDLEKVAAQVREHAKKTGD